MARRSCDGAGLLAAFRAAVANLETHVEEVNGLNVFPVPDGDTGSNMLATVAAALEEAERIAGQPADRVAGAISFGALMGARGNSGVIASQIFRGMADGLEGKRRFNGLDLAHALDRGTKMAYAAVAKPVEGTILTVVREAAAVAVETAERTNDLEAVLGSTVDAAERSVARTPSLLPILREAGVVDAGGQGLYRLFQGALLHLLGQVGAGAVSTRRLEAAKPSALVAHADEGFGYETMFLLWPAAGLSLDVDAIRMRLETIGESVLVAGDPRAVKGGDLIADMADYPSNWRPVGPQSNTGFNALHEGLMFESLLSLHPTTLEFIPSLATHWKKSADGLTYSFRINPNARWADGSPVTSDDVIATHDLLVDDTLAEPASKILYERYSRPVAESPYLVTVTVLKKHWRNFLTFSAGTSIFPAKVLKSFPNAEAWVRAHNTKFMMGSGPYEGRVEDQLEGKSMTVRRRPGYWAEKGRANVGLHNFDKITHLVINDEAMAFERFKKGELTCFVVATARRWVAEMTPDKVPEIKRNLIRKVKIFNEQPLGFQGIGLNMNVPPYDDLRVRKALALLLDRKTMLEKLMYNQYLPTRSYFSAGPYENPDNPRNDYDPRAALALLAEAGWKSRNSAGQLVNDKGEPFNVRILCAGPGLEKHLTLYQESLKQAGITATLELTRPDEQWQRVSEKKFEMVFMSWGGSLFPEPELSFRSTLAKITNNNNITGVADKRIDELLDAYGLLEIEQIDERVRILRELDGILARLYPYILLWNAPYTRIIHWDCLGYPESGLTRTGGGGGFYSLWWWDPEKAKRLEEAKRNPSITLPPVPSTIRFWQKGKDKGTPPAE